jgi:tetratricopeptide (TPR) repeat protein
MNKLRHGLLAAFCLTLLPSAHAAPWTTPSSSCSASGRSPATRRPAGEREKRFQALAAKAHQTTESFPNRAEPLIWEGIIDSSLAAEKGGLGALGLVKQARSLYERAIQIDGNALDGSAYNSLGVLYYKVPRWPVAFGDKAKAAELLQKALAVNPQGIDPNFFYGEFLAETDRRDEAIVYLERALQAPARPGRQIADSGRREEIRELLGRLKAR